MVGLTLLEPGFRRFRVKPEFTDKLRFAEAKYNSPKGLIAIKWERVEDGKYSMYVKVPFDTEAELVLPNGTKHILCSGEYTIAV